MLSKIEVPVLIVQGGRDESASPDAAVEMIQTPQNAGTANIELKLYPELDHGLMAADGQSHAKDVTAEAGAWLQVKLLPPLQPASDTTTAENAEQ